MSEKPVARPISPIYATLFLMIHPVGLECGYALCAHGSMARDLDIIAIPWTEDAKTAEELVEALLGIKVLGMTTAGENGSAKPHGRRAWTLLWDAGMFVDLSVMPLQRPKKRPKLDIERLRQPFTV